MIKSLKRAVYKNRLERLKKYFSDLDIRSQDVMLISGTPIGGTTWVNEVLSRADRVFDLWEPLHPKIFADFYSDGNRFWFDKYVPEGKECNELDTFLQELLVGEVITERLLQKNQKFNDYKNCDRLLVKFCRLNEILPWFVHQFPDYKILQIDRNPLAVISSQMKHGAWNLSKEVIESYKKRDKSYCYDFYNQFQDVIDDIEHPEEFLTVLYCVSILPRLSVESENVLAVKYEDLFVNPKETFNHIFTFFDLEPLHDLDNIVRKPSSTTKSGSNILDAPEQQLLTWKRNLNHVQTERIRSVLERFGFNEVGDIDYKLELDPKIQFFND